MRTCLDHEARASRGQCGERYEVTFASGDLRRVLIYVGLWGVGPDAWIQIDDFVIWRYSLEDDHTSGSEN